MNLEIDFTKSGGEVLNRCIEAYGFSSKLALAEHLGIASSSLSMRYKRDLFPADIVVRCVLETGANLEWLTFGTGTPFTHEKVDVLKITNFKLINGELIQSSNVMFDKVMFKNTSPLPTEPKCIQEDNTYYIIDKHFSNIFDGKWLVDIEGKISIRELTRIPIKKVRVSGVGVPFDCNLDDLSILGRVVTIIENQ
ncbi:phage repressor protein CI [Providencia alcalifaciens]|uniref:Bacteriophage CI repressor protein n=1 Tax=Providencia alcalifaciens 205/92 TaxID=1256988 RepID=A0AAV3M1K7_9GAMM|nr:phage repressor protein CI [Providencia alcalifaciens]ETT00171.1 bacteriophage CI repressor protein [Providencia alcalifaciens PAL-3]ETT04957.1 bacteriophage CI repressor protein [Providencia alcalifaciens F90-2004]EUC96844.1 bacteriophage CI repressor protein [Providencia alcalifaciens PAL-2]EUC98695.1 bacteriophage CI repressor protein [Providencia alcalifaciens PAL-1]EUD09690.1 bacteriophage CI repressor protein [Providencia alcalifaciens 205/92]